MAACTETLQTRDKVFFILAMCTFIAGWNDIQASRMDSMDLCYTKDIETKW